MKKGLLLLILLVSGCGGSTANVSPIIGTWLTATVSDTYGADGSFNEKITDSTLTVIQQAVGTFTVNGSALTIVVTSATPTIAGLPKTTVSQFIISGTSLTITPASGAAIKYTKQVN